MADESGPSFEGLSVAELRAFLDARGVSYHGVIEKEELVALARAVPVEIAAGSTEEAAPESEAVAMFMSFTGAGPEVAAHFLEMSGGELEAAVNLFMSMDHSAAPPQPPVMQFPAPGLQPPLGDTPAALGAAMAGFEPLFGGQNSADMAWPPNAAMNEDDLADLDSRSRANRGEEAAEATEDPPVGPDGVRAPLPQYRERLVGAGSLGLGGPRRGAVGMGGRGGDIPLYRAESEDTTDWMFPPPENLSFPAPFADARKAAKNEKRFLMINLQDPEFFESHRLNRDTWTDETIVELLRSSFIFWQRTTTSSEGRAYRERYPVTEGAKLPEIAILDPRTGARLLELGGFVHPEELCSLIMDFLGNHDLEDTDAKEVRRVRVADGCVAGALGNGGTSAATTTGAATATAASSNPAPEADPGGAEQGQTPMDLVEEKEERELVPEPLAGEPRVKLRVQMPNGSKVQRSFPPSASVGDVRYFLRQQMASWDQPIATFELSTNFPRKKYENDDESLADAGLAPQAMLFLRDLHA